MIPTSRLHKPAVGETLYSQPVNHEARKDGAPSLDKVVVKKVGLKYFIAGPEGMDNTWRDKKYEVATWKQVPKSGNVITSILFDDEEEWHVQKEMKRLRDKIRDAFSAYHEGIALPLHALKAIEEIIDTGGESVSTGVIDIPGFGKVSIL